MSENGKKSGGDPLSISAKKISYRENTEIFLIQLGETSCSRCEKLIWLNFQFLLQNCKTDFKYPATPSVFFIFEGKNDKSTVFDDL